MRPIFVSDMDGVLNIPVKENKKMDLKIYPNPANTNVQIEATFKIVRVELLDLNGQRLKSITSEEIDTSLLSPGLYLLKITDDRGRYHQNKLVIVQ